MGRYYSAKQKVFLWWRQGGCCGLCGIHMNETENPRAEYHHILKHANGGSTSIDNGVMLCKLCHNQSHNIGRFQDSVSVCHSEYKYANFSANGESIYSSKLSELKQALRDIDFPEYQGDLFAVKKNTTSKIFKILNEFKHLRLDKPDKNELFDRFNKVKKNIDEKFQEKIKENYSKAYNLTCEAQNISKSIDDIKKLPEKLKKYQEECRKYMLPKKEREEIKSRFQVAWDTFNNRKKKSQEDFVKESNKNFDYVKNRVQSIKRNINSTANLKNSRQELKQAQSHMKGNKFTKEHRETLFKLINSTFEKLNDKFQENQREYERECRNNRARSLDKLNGFYIAEDVDFKAKRAVLKSIQQDMKGRKYTKEDRQYIFDKINGYFDELHKVQTKVRERKQREWEERQRERERKNQEFKDRLKDNILRTKNSISKMEDSINIDKQRIREKESKLYSVPDKYKGNLKDSIRRIEDRVYSKQNKIQLMTNKVRDMQSKL